MKLEKRYGYGDGDGLDGIDESTSNRRVFSLELAGEIAERHLRAARAGAC